MGSPSLNPTGTSTDEMQAADATALTSETTTVTSVVDTPVADTSGADVDGVDGGIVNDFDDTPPEEPEAPAAIYKSDDQTSADVVASHILSADNAIGPDEELTANERIPSNWTIVAGDVDGMIGAKNLSTGRVFKGSMADFNKLLK